MNKISIWLWGFYYFNITLLEKLEYIEQFTNISWVEIVVEREYVFTKKELELLSKYKFNTLHLFWYTKNDKKWLKYCLKTIPNFQHFVLHPDCINIDDIDKDIEKHISFENMDIRKKSHRIPEDMVSLFKKLPESKFTFDINHAEENKIDYKDFSIVQFPSQLHFSVVNKNYYIDYPEIETSHAFACLEKWFNFDLKEYKDCIITMEWVFIPGKPKLIQEEINLIISLFK